MWLDGATRSITVHLHRLLAIAFLPFPETDTPNRIQVNHVDGNKSNNDLSNLEWVSMEDNVRHAYNNKLNKHENPVMITLNDGTVKLFRSQILAADFLDRHPATLSEALQTGRKCAGLKVEYL